MSGKTVGGGYKLVKLHEFNAFDYDGDPTFVPSLCVAPTYGNAADFDIPLLQDAIKDIGVNFKFHGSGSTVGGRFAGPALSIPEFGTRANPSCILIRTADIPKRITGFQVGASWGDEAARWKSDPYDPVNDPFVQINGRTRHPDANFIQILYTYTNEGDATKVYEMMHEGKKDRRLYRARTKDNPLAIDFYQRLLGELTPELVGQYLDGKAAPLRGGKVYPCFDFDIHVNDKVRLREGIPLQISMDFNVRPGVYLEIGQYHGDLDLFTVLHEITGPRMNAKDAIDRFIVWLDEQDWDFGVLPLEVFGDASGGAHHAGQGDSSWIIVQQRLKDMAIPYRIRVPRSNPSVMDRVNAFNMALQDARGEIHYHIHPKCKGLIRDLHLLQRDKYGEVDKTEHKLSHPSDAEGYRVWFVRPLRMIGSSVGGRIIM